MDNKATLALFFGIIPAVMRIGIDARMYGPKVGGGGLGRYVEQLITELQKQKTKDRFLVFVKPENAKDCRLPNAAFKKRILNIHWYTLKEQLFLGKTIDKENLDLIHFPHWNVPLNIKTPFIVTIHDLILLEEPRSARATTRNPLVYALKYAVYKRVLKHALSKSRAIIAVSEYTRDAILRFFPKTPAEKIHVIHEGVTALPQGSSSSPSAPSAPYFLYVGNAYPHKNLESLLHAFSFFAKLHPKVKLVLAGRKDVFYERLQKELDEIDVPASQVIFRMNPSDAELRALYEGASLYLFPSRSEGFGLPPLEAMSLGVPVAAANTTSLPEILGDAALYFHPDDIEEMVEVMEKALNSKTLRAKLSEKGKVQAKRYSWSRMAKETAKLYA